MANSIVGGPGINPESGDHMAGTRTSITSSFSGTLALEPKKLLQWATNAYCVQFNATHSKHRHYRPGSDLDGEAVCKCGYLIQWE